MYLSLVLAAALATPGIPFPGKSKKPKVELRSTSPMTLGRIDGGPTSVTFVLTVKNINEQFWCPRVWWFAGEGNTQSEESDCKPFEESTPQERAQETHFKTLQLRRGDWDVVVALSKGEKLIWRGSTKVVIR